MKTSGKRWNNILILAIIAFVVILNLPTLIKTYLLDKPPASAPGPVVAEASFPTLLNLNKTMTALHTADWSLVNKQGHWTLSEPLTLTPAVLLSHWQAIQGTVINDKTYHDLHGKLPVPQTVEVWYQDQEEPQRITYYQLPTFWLFKNWQNHWIAVTVDKTYLFPNQPVDKKG